MAVELGGSDLEDPFAKSSLLALLPRTLGLAPDACSNATETKDLDAIREFFKSMTVKGSSDLFEQAKAILGSQPDILNLYPENEIGVTPNGKDRPQGRRPALGRKRAKFSLKSESSHPVPNTDVQSVIERIEDPEEYFLAFEKLENVDKELRKLRGEVSTDLMRQHQCAVARKRRPGLLGKTASYKHHVSLHTDTAEGLTVSEKENIGERISTPTKTSVSTKSSATLPAKAINEPITSKANEKEADRILHATERDGSIAGKEKKVDNLLEDLLSTFKDLNGDEEATYLRERLRVKSIEVSKIRLPEMITFQANDSRVVNNSLMRKKGEGSSHSQTSTLARSPLAAISSLQRRIAAKDPLKGLYSIGPSDDVQNARESPQCACIGPSVSSVDMDPCDRDHSDAGFASPLMSSDGKRSNIVGELQSPDSDTDLISDTEIALETELAEIPSCLSRENPGCSSERIDADYVSPVRLDVCVDEENNSMHLDASVSEQVVSGRDGMAFGNMNTDGITCNGQSDSNLVVHVDDSSCAIHDMLNCKLKYMVEGGVQPGSADCFKDSSNTVKETVPPLNEQPENSEMISEDNNQQEHQENPQMLPKRGARQKVLSRGQNKKKDYARRQSLTGAGTKWECGVRRSTRIKHRPLRHWCGEKLLYGRIHDSLATVIGVKYASPGDKALKVKSYVSDKYADLVTQAAL